MARQIESGKFLVIECTAGELMDAVGSDICICDWCGKPQPPSEKGCYIAVLNQWFCKDCYGKWAAHAVWYPQDADIERRNFGRYAPRLGVKCQ